MPWYRCSSPKFVWMGLTLAKVCGLSRSNYILWFLHNFCQFYILDTTTFRCSRFLQSCTRPLVLTSTQWLSLYQLSFGFKDIFMNTIFVFSGIWMDWSKFTLYSWQASRSYSQSTHLLLYNKVIQCRPLLAVIPGLILGLRPANETPLLCNNVSHWQGANLESDLDCTKEIIWNANPPLKFIGDAINISTLIKGWVLLSQN